MKMRGSLKREWDVACAPKRGWHAGAKGTHDANCEAHSFVAGASRTARPDRRRRTRIALVLAVAAIGVIAALLLPPLAQSPDYHKFADPRTMLGILNFLDVVSNAAFLVVGLLGLRFLVKNRGGEANGSVASTSESWLLFAFFAGTALTALGSGYYHWAPSDATLVWDRLPMTVIFMSILAVTVAERVSPSIGLGILAPLLLAGAGAVFSWQASGNLWPYAAAQYLSLFVAGTLILLLPSPYSHSADWLRAVGIYAVAKLAEVLDKPVFEVTRHLASGHTLKHFIAAFSVYWVLRMLRRRQVAIAQY